MNMGFESDPGVQFREVGRLTAEHWIGRDEDSDLPLPAPLRKASLWDELVQSLDEEDEAWPEEGDFFRELDDRE